MIQLDKDIVLNNLKQPLETQFHVHLLMAMEQGQSRLPWDKVYLCRLIGLQRDHIFLHPAVA